MITMRGHEYDSLNSARRGLRYECGSVGSVEVRETERERSRSPPAFRGPRLVFLGLFPIVLHMTGVTFEFPCDLIVLGRGNWKIPSQPSPTMDSSGGRARDDQDAKTAVPESGLST